MLRKLFRPAVTVNWDIVEKETVDEIIFRTAKIRNRIMLELMARGGMRIGEVLKLRPKDIQDSKLVISDPKSGWDTQRPCWGRKPFFLISPSRFKTRLMVLSDGKPYPDLFRSHLIAETPVCANFCDSRCCRTEIIRCCSISLSAVGHLIGARD